MSAQLSSDTSSSLGGDPLIGRMFGAYRVVRRIGEGGMGVVYEGRGAGTPARAAIKVLHPNLANDGKTLQRFFNEARAIRAVKHSGIVEILDFGQQPDGLAFILMEYLDGETLLVRMEQANARGEALGLCSVVQLSQQITAALLAIHERNIVHRDLKPENIFIIPDPQLPSGERVKLLDFGIAKVLDGPARKTTVGMVLGTPLYMSPEQCEGRDDLSPKADVYAIGVLMFEMLAGRLPFTAESSAAMMRQHLFKSPPELAALVPQVPPQLGTLVGRMLSKSPESRPPIAEVVPELERLLPHVLNRTESLVQGLSLSAPTRVERVPLTHDPEQTPLRPQPAHRMEALPVDSTLAVQVGTTLKQPQVLHSSRRWATIVSAAIVALLVIGAGYFGVSALTSAKAPVGSQVTPRVQPPRSGADVVVSQPIAPKDPPTVAAPVSAPTVKHEEGRPSKKSGKGSDPSRPPRAKAASGNQMARWEVD